MSDSFIINVPELEGAAKDMQEARVKFATSVGVIEKAFQGIEWTDDNGQSFQDQVTTFKKECNKVSARLTKNSITLNKAANAASQTQAEIKTQVGMLYK